ncbi:beta-carotene 15,15'-monooxygenase [Rubrobacter tropicus]|uniref:Probable beta-carotene 15,15'-dioxygenase n=1 Tax=Rubrobacter tropicus TaxID=2653851 RepID=A0A6G8QAF0_9ACTN|nr:Brp/Blh family beta-carotene 15,15'-dioxygenase [Rubrobacter tropicus]QIN83451.1 beta-carotene 15,15'-monooxygenase [Rubrobacter tropicus]
MSAKSSDSDPRPAPPAVRGAVVWPSLLIVLALTVAFAAGLHAPAWAQYLPFAASLVLFGLPHGAVDHLVPSRFSGRKADGRGILAVVLLYIFLSGLCLILWFVAPAIAFALFICVTVFHWGAGELHAALFFGPDGLGGLGPTGRVFLVLLRGGIPMLVPLLFFPDAYEGVAADAAGLFGPGAAPSWAFGPAFRLAAGAALSVVALVLVSRAVRDGVARRAVFPPLALETLLLFAFFAVVPPILAVGLYFTIWHAPRHIARLVLLDPGASTDFLAGRPGRAVSRFAKDAAPLTGLALALLAGLYFAVPRAAQDPGSLLALYLVLVSALTLPHASLVAYMDLRQGVWKRSLPPAGAGHGPVT